MGVAVGLDGCPSGWIAAVVEGGRLAAVEHVQCARAALEAYPDAGAFAFDIPIGLSPNGKRDSDIAAREFLGERANSVFWSPLRAVIDVDASAFATHREAYAEARRVSMRASGGGQSLSSQSFMLVPKIREVAEVAADPRVYEAHPEVSFAELAGGRALPSKKTWDGLMQRRALLSAAGLVIPDPVGEASRRGAADDIVDAVACAWTAARIARGEARSLPDPPQRLEGREVAIWY
ncbi:MAG: DUF429 domain-containing protein [Chloroflexi bacterium]|nr:DUF429 domain-containing protein [Chloroflexota bacterium]